MTPLSKTEIYTVNAFTQETNGGNPAGVVTDADGLSEQDMQGIAKQVGFSETAFVLPSKTADYRLRYFTPVSEVNLCGHATIATFSLLFQQGQVTANTYSLETKAGVLSLEVQPSGLIIMSQSAPCFGAVVEASIVADSLNCAISDLAKDLPCQIVSTGLPDVIVPIVNMDTLLKIQPNFNRIAELSQQWQVVGYHLFARNKEDTITAHCRNFAPLLDIPEEAATGTASGALSCYLFKHGLITAQQAENIVFEQGASMGRPSHIQARLKIQDNRIGDVFVGGQAVQTGKREGLL